MFRPDITNVKFKKKFFIYSSSYNLKGCELKIGDFGLKCLRSGLLRSNQLEALFKTLKKEMKKYNKKGKIWVNCFPHFSYTKKPNEVRMGKGKGNIVFYYSLVKKGTVIIEIKGLTETEALKVLTVCMPKLPFKSKIIKKVN